MPLYTPEFLLAMFDVGEDLRDNGNVIAERNRFVIIDRQFYGLYSVFGSGVIDGWDVVIPQNPDPNNISVDVAPGVGIVNLIAGETLYSSTVEGLPPNAVVYIFAQATTDTALNKTVTFVRSSNNSASTAILLATVVTGDTGIVSIDNTVRRRIGFEEIIAEQIRLHKHRGTPSKIDLADETRGKLPGYKVSEIDASKLKGRLSPDRLGRLSHAALADVGLFDHAAIDALLKKIEERPDEQRMLETTFINELRRTIFLKYQFADADKHFLNSFVFIPGVSPEEWVDTDATTANVNTDSQCISGEQATGGDISSVLWDSKVAFGGYKVISNATVGDAGVSLVRADLQTLLVEGFEGAPNGSMIDRFQVSTVASDSETQVTADGTVRVENQNSGRFTVQQTNRGTFVRKFATPQDWTAWDRLTLAVKCSTPTHGAVSMALTAPEGGMSNSLEILAPNEQTANVDPDRFGFEDRTLLLSTFGGLNKVTGMVFTVDDVSNAYSFWIDDIRLRRTQSYVASGTVRYRYGTGSLVTFNSVRFEATTPTGTSVRVRIRVASTEGGLDSAVFSPYLGAAEAIDYRGKWAEIEVGLFSDSGNTLSPTLTLLELGVYADSEFTGFTVSGSTAFARGSASNMTFVDSGATATIRQPVTVGNTAYLNARVVSEVGTNNLPLSSVTGQSLPMSEVQAFAALADASIRAGFSNPKAAVRTNDRRYVIADTDNHRVAIFDSSGQLTSILAGVNVDADPNNNPAIPLTATFNPGTGVLWLGFSRVISVPAASLSRVRVQVAGRSFDLSEEGQTLNGEVLIGRALPIPLTSEHRALLTGLSEPANVTYDNPFVTGFDALYAGRQLRIYEAPIRYFDFIYFPIYAAETENGTYLICNATKLPIVNEVDPSTPQTLYLQELSPYSGVVQSSNSLCFSYAFAGMVAKTSTGRYVAAGVDETRRGMVILDPFSQSPTPIYRSPTGNYPSCLDFAADGSIWLGESSEVARGGRLVQMDLRGNLLNVLGDVYTKVNSIQALVNGHLLLGT